MLYLLVQMVFTWHAANSDNAQALAEQTVAMKTAEIARAAAGGSGREAGAGDEGCGQVFEAAAAVCLLASLLAELGALAKKQGVKLTRAQYAESPVMVGTPGDLTEVRMDAGLSGDYRPLVLFINGLERDKMFFLIVG